MLSERAQRAPTHTGHGRAAVEPAVEKITKRASTAPLHRPHIVTRGCKALQLYSAVEPLQLYSSTSLYSLQPLQHPSGRGYVLRDVLRHGLTCLGPP